MIAHRNKEGRVYALLLERDGEERAIEVNPILFDALHHFLKGNFTGKVELSMVQGNIAGASLQMNAEQLKPSKTGIETKVDGSLGNRERVLLTHSRMAVVTG